MPTVAAFLKQLELPADIRSVPGRDISRLVSAMGGHNSRLAEMCYPRIEKAILIRDHLLPRHYVDTFSMRWCPACLRESQYHRECWNLAFVKVCHVHQLRLLQACPNCTERVRWSRPGIRTCGCGAELLNMEARSCHGQLVEATSFLVRIFDGSLQDCSRPTVLKGMALREVVSFISLLGRMACEAKGIEPGSGRPMTWSHAADVIAEGYEVANGWPQSFRTLLDSLSKDASYEASNLKDIFGSSYAAMRRAPLQSFGRTIRSVLTPYCYERFGIAVDGYLPEHIHLGQCSLENARAAIGATSYGFGKIKRQLVLHRKGRQKFVKEVDIRQMCEWNARFCNAKTMGQLLGLHVKKQIKEIADSRVFAVDATPIDKRSRIVDRSKVENFVCSINCASQRHDKPMKQDSIVNWPQLRRLASQRGITLPNLIQLMIDRRLSPRDSALRGLPGLSFDRADAILALNDVVCR